MNIALKGVFVISLYLLCAFPLPLKAEEPVKKLFSFSLEPTLSFFYSLEPTLGFFYGQSEEIVYKNNTGDYLSELLWDMKPLLYCGIDLSLGLQIPSWRPVSVYTVLSAKIGKDGFSGIMEDRDWQQPDADFLTNYSRHNAFISDAWFFDADIGLSRPLRPGMAFNPALSVFVRLSYMEMTWIARDGYTQYGENNDNSPYVPWDDSFDKIPMEGDGIQYSQKWLLVSPGLAAGLPLSDFFTLDFSFTITPFVIAAAEDLHLITKMEYQDRPRCGIALEPECRITFFPNRLCSLSFRASWRYISGSAGQAWKRPISGGIYTDSGTGGGGLNVLNAGISLKISL
jgi:outer membrane protease